MIRLRSFFYGLFFFGCLLNVNAQELQCIVTIDASQVPDLQQSIRDNLKRTISDFLNNRIWTNDNFSTQERIRCNFTITIKQIPEPYTYKATLQVQSTRPVYNTSYETILLNYLDNNFDFTLNDNQPINFNENIFNENLSSMLGFYAYIILALDYDSFSKLSGQQYVEKAFNIANVAQQAGGGWSTNDPINRYGLIENLNSQLLVPFRENFYTYHRLAMDTYLQDPDAARLKILDMFLTIKRIRTVKPYSILLRSFFLAKRDELINIFRDSTDPDIKNKAVTLLRELDPLNSEKYGGILIK